VDDVESLEHNLTAMVHRLDNINVGVLALRRLHRINVSAVDLRPLVDVLTTTDPTQLQPIKRELAHAQTLADDVSVRVRHCYLFAPQPPRQPAKLKPSYDPQQTWPPPRLQLLTLTK